MFPYYPNIPGPLLPEGAELVAITSDPDEAARAPMGDAIVADVRVTLERLLEEVAESDRDPGEPLPEPTAGPEQDPITGTAAMNALAAAFPEDGIVVLEAPSSTLSLRNQLRLSRPGATTSAPEAGSASGSRPRSACSSPNPTGRSSA